tara:strand:- start:11269 stop:12432 length:1164 start_codon:yes stop_codon:yes gene_type:complete
LKKELISLSVPSIIGNEWKYVKDCLDTEWISSAGKFVDKFENSIAKYTGSKHAIACVNGTASLFLSLKLAGVKSDEEVIISTLTFIAPVNAITYLGANPIFMDVDNYFNIDCEKTIDFIKNKTFFKSGNTYNTITRKRISAIIPVHVWGNAVQLLELKKLCKERNIKIVEDASESLGTFYLDGELSKRHTGTIGKFGCLSFNGNKIISSGGGGMILTNHESLAEEAKYYSTQAKDDGLKYIHNNVGYNLRLTNVQAAIGLAQLELINKFLCRKREIYRTYDDYLSKINGVELMKTPAYAKNNHWLNVVKIDKGILSKDIDAFILDMKSNNIEVRPIWKLNHLQKPYIRCQSYIIEKALRFVESCICLPSSSNLKDEEIKKVVDVLNE